MTAKTETTCLYCDCAFEGDYCPRCGEKAEVRRLSWRKLGDDVLYSFTSMDRGFIFTIRELFSRPGHLMRDYLAGRRRCYYRPFAMLILLAGAYLVLNTLLFPAERAVGIGRAEQQTVPALSAEILEIPFSHPATFSLLLLLSIALVIPLVFRKNGGRQYNYVEYLFVGAYMTSQRFLIDIALLPYKLIPESAGWPDVKLWVMLAYVGLTAWNFRQFFGLRWRSAIPRTIGLMLLAAVPTIVLLILIVGIVLLAGDGMTELINEIRG